MKTKKLIFMALLCLLTDLCYSQTVNNTYLKDIDTEYIQLVGKPIKTFSRKIKLLVDSLCILHPEKKEKRCNQDLIFIL